MWLGVGLGEVLATRSLHAPGHDVVYGGRIHSQPRFTNELLSSMLDAHPDHVENGPT